MLKLNWISGFIILLLISVSCSEEPVKKEAEVPKTKELIKFNTENLDTLNGIYIGDFGGTDIRIVLTHIGKNHVVGYNIFKGLRRNISGNYKLHGDTVEMILHEPGDNEFDGVFEMEIYRSNFTGKGKWESNSGKFPKKYFKLEKLEMFDSADDIKKLNNSNFSSHFSWVEDSLGSIQFEDDGSCIYRYYPGEDEKNRVEQMVEILGSWTLKNELVKIAWQPNSVFPSRMLDLQILMEDYALYSKSTGRMFNIAEINFF